MNVRPTRLTLAILMALATQAQAAPTDGVISAGTGSIAQSGAVTTVSQSSQNLAINWQSFNIAANETVNFVQPNAQSIALNRVLGTDGTTILGQLNANGQVWVLNPNGVLFGKGAQANVGGLVASTLDISDADFLAGKRTFTGSGGTVTNEGEITAGYAALLGGTVVNDGIVTANLGTVALAAGDKVTLDFDGDRLINVQVDEGALAALVENRQLIRADGGLVVMTAKAKDALLGAVVNNEGVIEARTLENRDGRILLLGDMQNGTVNVAGTLDASAPNGGGGGFIETSAARVQVSDTAEITTAAAEGQSGEWLIDPYDFTIAASGGDITGAALSAALGAGAVTIQTAAGSVSCTGATCGAGNSAGNGDIFVNDSVSWSANALTLSAYRNIAINANLNGSGTASLALQYGQGAVAAGNTASYTLGSGAKVTLPAGLNFSTKLGSDGGTTNWTVITGLGAQGSTTGTDLQGMQGNLSGNYVLGADIDASATSTWNGNQGFTPVGQQLSMFTGKFDGLGHTISGLTINLPGGNNMEYGMFGDVNNAVLQNVGLLNVNILGGSNGFTGALAGAIRGTTTVRNVYVDGGSVSTATQTVGGLVGVTFAGSSISHSYANVSVSAGIGGGSGQASAGGLVGVNNGAISYSYATGSVSTSTGSAQGRYVGGLVGIQNAGSIDHSYATGAVSGNNTLGGLIGNLTGGSAPTSSYWDITTTGQNSSVGSGTAGGTGLTTAQWLTLGPIATGAWLAADWGTGYPYPVLKTLPYITITASASQVYGSAATIGVASILDQSGTDASGLVNIGGLIWNVSTSASSAAGTTAIVSGSGASATGYQVLYAGNVTVSKAPLLVTANGASKTYNGLAYSGGNGVSYSGFVNSDTVAVLGGTLSYGGTAQGAVNAGGYTIVPSGLADLSGNYTITYVNGALTVNAASLTVTAGNVNQTYNGIAFSGGNGVSYSGFVNGEGASVLSGTLTYGGTSQGAVNAGSYGIVPSGLSSGNYTITYVNGSLSITPAALVITANNASKTYGSTLTFTGGEFTAAGLVNGETVGSVSLASGGAAATAGVAGGPYAITAGNATGGSFSAGNYSITYVNGSLVVTPAALTVSAGNAGKTYDGLAFGGGNGATYSGFVNGETAAVLSGTLSYGGTAQGAVNAGSYSITLSGLSSTNYVIGYVNGALTVTPATLTVTSGAVTKTYDGTTAANGVAIVSAGQLFGSDSLSGGTFAFTDKNAGTGKVVTVSGVTVNDGNGGNNYAMTYADNTASVINRAALTVVANDDTKILSGMPYGGGNGVSYSGFVNGETAAALGGALAYGGTSQGATEIGSYAITPSGLTSGNYAIVFVDGALTIVPRPGLGEAYDSAIAGTLTQASKVALSVPAAGAVDWIAIQGCGVRMPAGVACGQ